MRHPQSQMPIPMTRMRQKRFPISHRGYHLEIRLISHPLAAHKAPRLLCLLACLLVYLPEILLSHHHLAHRRLIYYTISPQMISSLKAHHPPTL